VIISVNNVKQLVFLM